MICSADNMAVHVLSGWELRTGSIAMTRCQASWGHDDDDSVGLSCTAPSTLLAAIGWCADCKLTSEDCFTLGHTRLPEAFTTLCDTHGLVIRSWVALVSIRTLERVPV